MHLTQEGEKAKAEIWRERGCCSLAIAPPQGKPTERQFMWAAASFYIAGHRSTECQRHMAPACLLSPSPMCHISWCPLTWSCVAKGIFGNVVPATLSKFAQDKSPEWSWAYFCTFFTHEHLLACKPLKKIKLLLFPVCYGSSEYIQDNNALFVCDISCSACFFKCLSQGKQRSQLFSFSKKSNPNWIYLLSWLLEKHQDLLHEEEQWLIWF